MSGLIKIIKSYISKNYLNLLIIFLPVFYSYFNIWNTFFVADAWNMLNSHTLVKSFGVEYFFQLFAMPYGVHFLPIGVLISTLQTQIFGINSFGYGIVSLILHSINVFLVYYSVKKLSKNNIFSLLAGIFFGVNFQIREGVFWFASNTWTELSTTFVLLAIIYLINFYKNRNLKYAIFSYISVCISLFLREYTFMLFGISILAFLYMIFENSKNYLRYLKLIFLYICTILIYLFLRVFFVYAQNPVILTLGERTTKQLIATVIFYLFTLPSNFLGNIIVPEKFVIFLSELVSKYVYSDVPIAQTAVFQTVLFLNQIFIFFGFLVLFSLLIMIFKANFKEKEEKFTILLYFLSLLIVPLIFLTLDGYLFWLFSRYLYLPCAIFTVILFFSASKIKSLNKINFISVILLTVYVLYIVINAWLNHNFFSEFAKVGALRRNILINISKELNFKNRNQIIFVKSRNSLSDNRTILDFGSNSGKVILTWSWFNGNQNNIPQCLLDPLFLFKETNGYRFCEGKGYGYFQDINLLKETVKKNKIKSSEIISFQYDPKANKLSNISDKIRDILNE